MTFEESLLKPLLLIYLLILIGFLFVIYQTEPKIEPCNEKVLTPFGLFNYDSDVSVEIEQDMLGEYYVIVKIYSGDNFFHFDRIIPKDVISHEDYKRSIYLDFKGGCNL